MTSNSPKVPTTDHSKKSLSEEIMALKAENPSLSARKIAAKLCIDHKTVLRHLRKPKNVKTFEEIEKETQKRLVKIRSEALNGLALLVKGDHIEGKNMSVWLNTIKFILGPSIQKHLEPQPDTLIFEAVIQENGSLIKNVRKLFEGDFHDD